MGGGGGWGGGAGSLMYQKAGSVYLSPVCIFPEVSSSSSIFNFPPSPLPPAGQPATATVARAGPSCGCACDWAGWVDRRFCRRHPSKLQPRTPSPPISVSTHSAFRSPLSDTRSFLPANRHDYFWTGPPDASPTASRRSLVFAYTFGRQNSRQQQCVLHLTSGTSGVE